MAYVSAVANGQVKIKLSRKTSEIPNEYLTVSLCKESNRSS